MTINLLENTRPTIDGKMNGNEHIQIARRWKQIKQIIEWKKNQTLSFTRLNNVLTTRKFCRRKHQKCLMSTDNEDEIKDVEEI